MSLAWKSAFKTFLAADKEIRNIVDWSRSEHPHIVKMYECFEERHSLWVVPEAEVLVAYSASSRLLQAFNRIS